MSLKTVKNKIRSVKKIRQVTKAMEAVSAVKMRKSQQAALLGRPYANAALSILRRVSATEEAKGHPLITARPEIKRYALVIITSDRGLAGSLNSAVLKESGKLVKKEGLTKDNTDIIAVGRKGKEYFARRGYNLHEFRERWGEGIAMESPEELALSITTAYALGAFDKVFAVYTNFVSTFRQEPVAHTILPIIPEEVSRMVEIIPGSGRSEEDEAQYLFEPSAGAVLDTLIPQLLAIELYHAVLESNASEHSARMVAMKNASDRARDLTKELTLEYNKERQSSITAEIGEITSGIEAMR